MCCEVAATSASKTEIYSKIINAAMSMTHINKII